MQKGGQWRSYEGVARTSGELKVVGHLILSRLIKFFIVIGTGGDGLGGGSFGQTNESRWLAHSVTVGVWGTGFRSPVTTT